MDTRQTLTKILGELGIDPAGVVDGAHLTSDLELDSTEMVDISLELRRRLGVVVTLEAHHDLTVTQVCELVERASAEGPVAAPIAADA
jgi:acyl carrier protein